MITTEKTNINVQLSGIQNSGGIDTLVKENLQALHQMVPISTAKVVLERQHESAPAFRVSAHLAVPGPDIHAAARDHTLLAAWRKLAGILRKQFLRRRSHNQLRLKGREQCRTVTSQWSHA